MDVQRLGTIRRLRKMKLRLCTSTSTVANDVAYSEVLAGCFLHDLRIDSLKIAVEINDNDFVERGKMLENLKCIPGKWVRISHSASSFSDQLRSCTYGEPAMTWRRVGKDAWNVHDRHVECSEPPPMRANLRATAC